jgi:predicted O-methyltransferase YrrM
MSKFEFTTTWFDEKAKPVWDYVIPEIKPSTILEIGSYEGASACYLIEMLAKTQDIELHCIDTWEGGIEHQDINTSMDAVEKRFTHNIAAAKAAASHDVNIVIHKDQSDMALARLLVEGKRNYFDFIYVDGSHQAADVLYDAAVAFRLLKGGGLMVFDDYLWYENLPGGKDLLRCPKPAIDAFVNLNINKLEVLTAPLYQFYVSKRLD